MLTVTEYTLCPWGRCPRDMPRPTYGPRLRRTPVGGFDGGSQGCLAPYVLVPSPGGAHLSILEHVAEPQCVGINAHLVGDHVRVGLHREHHLGLSRRAIGAAGHVVRVHHVAVDLKMGDVVLPPGRVPAAGESGAALKPL